MDRLSYLILSSELSEADDMINCHLLSFFSSGISYYTAYLQF